MKVKIVSHFLVILLVSLFVCGCNSKQYEISEGTYTAIENETEILPPFVSFDLDEQKFSFSYDSFSSYYPTGVIKIQDDIITATTVDEKYTYIFRIIDNHTICFVQEGSAEIKTVQGNVPVVDGTQFVLEEK